jgi:hypothetical protein
MCRVVPERNRHGSACALSDDAARGSDIHRRWFVEHAFPHLVWLHDERCTPPRPRDAPRATPRGHASVARETTAAYDAPAHPTLRDAVGELSRAVDQVLALATDQRRTGGELGALLDLLPALDLGHAAAIAITDQALERGLAERKAGLSFDALLAMRSATTAGDRGVLQRLAQLLRQMPHLRRAVHDGAVGSGQLRAIAAEAKVLSGDALTALDASFADVDRLRRFGPDELLDLVRDQVDRLRPDLAERREQRAVEGSRLVLQPTLDGRLEGWFSYDQLAGSTLTDALDAAAASPAFADTGFPRANQRADALIEVCEDYLTGSRCSAAGDTDEDEDAAPSPRRSCRPARRSKPRAMVVLDVRDLTGDRPSAKAARLLWRMWGSPPALTAAGIDRLVSDTDLQFLLVDRHTVLGTTEPTSTIPTAVRRVVMARDQRCRFPHCRTPASWCDLHHVRAVTDGGPTTVENLVCLCRRHHGAVTAGRWTLTMTDEAVVTVRRGRLIATSQPPLHVTLIPVRGSPGADPPDTS